jgi:hypothetical protein
VIIPYLLSACSLTLQLFVVFHNLQLFEACVIPGRKTNYSLWYISDSLSRVIFWKTNIYTFAQCVDHGNIL